MFKNNSIFKSRSVLFTWMLSYISILLIPIIISMFVYFKAENIIQSELNRSNSAFLTLVQNDIDNKLSDLDTMRLQIASSVKLQSLLKLNTAPDISQVFTVTDVMTEVRSSIAYKPYIDSVYILLRASDKIITRAGFYTLPELYSIYHDVPGYSYEDFTKFMKNVNPEKYGLINVKTGNITGDKTEIKQMITVTSTLPFDELKNPAGTLVVLIDESKIQDIIQKIKSIDEASIFILGRDNRIISTNKAFDLPEDLRYENLVNPNKTKFSTINGEKVAVSFSRSLATDWKYVSVIPESVFLSRVQYVRRLTLIGILLCVLIGGVAAYLFTKRNYNPINELVHAIALKAGIPVDKSHNEYRFIRDALSNTYIVGKEVNEKIKKQNLILRSNFLMRLLKGRLENDPSIDSSLSYFNINFGSESFAVMLFYFEHYDEPYPEKDHEENLKLVQFIISNVIEELVAKKHRGFMVEVDEMMACLININDENISSVKEDLDYVAKEAQEFLINQFNIRLSIATSNVHNGYTGIPKAYQETLEAMEYKMVMGSGKVIHFDDISNSLWNYYYPIEAEQQLINYIKIGDFEKAKDWLGDIFKNNFASDYPSIKVAKCLMFNLTSTLIKAIDKVDTVYRDSFIEELHSEKSLINCETVMEMKERATKILKEACEYASSRKKSRNQQLKEELIEYIDKNYSDANLSVTMIAELYNKHPVYLSSFCKEQIGESLSDYINKIRVNKAKLFLKEQNVNIGDIAKMVGYYNSNALIRAFKKYEGMTPGQYKELG